MILLLDLMRYFDFGKITASTVLENFLSLITGLIVAGLFYLVFLRKIEGIRLKYVMLIGGLSAFFEYAVLELFHAKIIYWNLQNNYLTLIINAALISFLSLFAYWQILALKKK